MIRETFPVGLLGCNCSILGDETSREAIVVDPGYDIPQILLALAKHQLTVKKIFVTHAHIDHIASAQSLKAITGAPVIYYGFSWRKRSEDDAEYSGAIADTSG